MATKFETARATLTDLTTAYAQELAKYSDENPPDATQLATLQNMKAAVMAAKADVDAASGYGALIADWSEMQEVIRHGQQGGGAHPAPEGAIGREIKRLESVGHRFVSNDGFKEWIARMAPNGTIPDSIKGIQSPPMQFGGLAEIRSLYADLLTGASSTSAGAFVTPAQYLGLTELGRRPLTLRDVVTNLTTSSDTVEYVRVTTETNNAAPVAEATGAGDGTGVKPESALAFERVSTPVVTIAHWIPATKRAISDAGQLRGLIDQFLRYGLEEELEDQIANGNGGEGFTGILNTSGTQAQAWDTNILKTTRVARRKVRTVGRRTPNAYLLNPEDWETIDLLQDNEARYFFGGPSVMGTPRLWGLPVIESEAIPVGTGLVGDFTTCVLWDREQGSISISDSHSDFFTRNLVAILAELRAAFGILKPNAIVEIDLTA